MTFYKTILIRICILEMKKYDMCIICVSVFLGPGERVDVVTLTGEKEAWRAEPRAERDLLKQRDIIPSKSHERSLISQFFISERY